MFVYEQNNIIKKNKYFKKKMNEDILNYYKDLVQKKVNPVYKTLKEMRHYKIPKEIGCFELERYKFEYEDIVNLYFYNWEYYANFSPLWKNRFESWGVEFDSDYKPKFLNDDVLEAFYKKYNLEPDEQSQETHDKSICKICKYPLLKWIDSIEN